MYMYHMCIYLLLTVVNCGNLTNPTNGQVSYTAGTTLGQTATYSCNTGYNLVGNSTRTCLAIQECGLEVYLPVKVCCHPAPWITLHNI